MKNVFASFIIIMAIYCPVHAQNAANLIEENEVPMNILVRHFNKYPGCTVSGWYKIQVDGADFFRASFIHQNQKGESTYQSSGTLLEESRYIEQLVPAHIYNVLSEEYGKYKLVALKRIENLLTGDVVFLADIKTKERGSEQLYFDDKGPINPTAQMLAMQR